MSPYIDLSKTLEEKISYLFDHIEKLEKKHHHLDKRMDGWVSQIIKYKGDIDDKLGDERQDIAELKEKYKLNEQQYKIVYNRQEKLESVLKDHLESHENVARGQLNPDISQTALFQLFDRDIKKQLQKLSRQKDEPYRMCPKCGTCMVVDIATLNKIDWYCPKCNPPINPLNIVIDENGFTEGISETEWLKPKPESDIMHCFCCGTDITDETNCFCLTCFNDKIAHDIKKDMVISREDYHFLMRETEDNNRNIPTDDHAWDRIRDIKKEVEKLKEVEEEVEKK